MNTLITDKDIALQEKQEQVQQQYVLLPIESIRENTWNPNKLDNIDFEKLKASIEKDNGNKNWPIFVRPHPEEAGLYEIVDGAHRYKCMRELGFEEIVAVIENLNDTEARLRTIGFNKFRGNFDNVLLANLIHELKTTYSLPDSALNEALGYSEEEIKSLEALVDFDFNKYDENDKVDFEEEPSIIPDKIEISLNQTQLQELENIIAETGIKDKSKAILMMAKWRQEAFRNGLCKKEDVTKLITRIDSLDYMSAPVAPVSEMSDDEKADALIPDEAGSF